jgi:hypothetical protein
VLLRCCAGVPGPARPGRARARVLGYGPPSVSAPKKKPRQAGSRLAGLPTAGRLLPSQSGKNLFKERRTSLRRWIISGTGVSERVLEMQGSHPEPKAALQVLRLR